MIVRASIASRHFLGGINVTRTATTTAICVVNATFVRFYALWAGGHRGIEKLGSFLARESLS